MCSRYLKQKFHLAGVGILPEFLLKLAIGGLKMQINIISFTP